MSRENQPNPFERRRRVLEDEEDVRAAAVARRETGRVSQEELERELGLNNPRDRES
ncbi:hypothetical protein ABH903_003613 [Brevibacterium epidermidis]|uniref:Antitoxin VbhA domain-containing protein n=1 Tax=Brevibacterium epidermidis TaxID=1698 RepID=A0ABV4EQQ8_BREEP